MRVVVVACVVGLSAAAVGEEPSKYQAAQTQAFEAAGTHGTAQAKVEMLEKAKAKAADLKEPKAVAKKAKDEFEKAVKELDKETAAAFKGVATDRYREMLNLNITNAQLIIAQSKMKEAMAADPEQMRAHILTQVNYLTLYTTELRALPKGPPKAAPKKK